MFRQHHLWKVASVVLSIASRGHCNFSRICCPHNRAKEFDIRTQLHQLEPSSPAILIAERIQAAKDKLHEGWRDWCTSKRRTTLAAIWSPGRSRSLIGQAWPDKTSHSCKPALAGPEDSLQVAVGWISLQSKPHSIPQPSLPGTMFLLGTFRTPNAFETYLVCLECSEHLAKLTENQIKTDKSQSNQQKSEANTFRYLVTTNNTLFLVSNVSTNAAQDMCSRSACSGSASTGSLSRSALPQWFKEWKSRARACMS